MIMKRHSYIVWGIALMIFLGGLSSCLVGPKLQDPELGEEQQYRFDSLLVDTIGNLIWWELFPDTQLYNLVEIALVENKIVQLAAARISEASSYVGFTRADQLPQFNGQIGVSRSNIFVGQNLGAAQNTYSIFPSMSWEIDFWGKYRHATRAARQELLASEYAQRTILLDLVAAVATNYILLMQFDDQRNIARRTVESRSESSRIVRLRYEYGTVAEIDLNQAEIQEGIAAAAVPMFERLIAQTEHVLSILLGRNPGFIYRGEFDAWGIPPEIPPGMPSEILARRPDIMESYHLLEAQNEYIGVAVAKRLPNISINALAGFANSDIGMVFTPEGAVWQLGADLFQPIFQFGKNLRRVEIEEERLRQQLKSYENTVLIAFQEVEDALLGVDTYDRELQARVMQRDAAVNANFLSRSRYDGGQTSYLEVLDSERSMFDAELATSAVRAEFLISYVDLYRALGGGWLTVEEKDAEEAAKAAAEEEARQIEEARNN
jgi:outer membrane protein, multidrug efflux system